MCTQSGNFDDKKKILKELIKKLHTGENPEKIKAQFGAMIQDIKPEIISQIEQELISEGMPREEILKLCDVHLGVLKESLEKEKIDAPAGHPVSILMKEHSILLKMANDLRDIAKVIMETEDSEQVMDDKKHVSQIVDDIKDSENHYLREENVLFPYLEKHGVTEPPAVMWMEHDEIRKIKKHLYKLTEAMNSMITADFGKHLRQTSTSLAEKLSSHFYKENNILFPTALRVINDDEWIEARQQFDEIGYCCFTPALPELAAGKEKSVSASGNEGRIFFETGNLAFDEVEAIFNTLPVDVTFIDKDDTVKYFSQTKDRIFVRTPAVIGRKVQKCHPQKSVHLVEQILKDFKSGKRESTEFWIHLEENYVYIRYFPVLSKSGEYMGCVEVTQEISDIQKIEGEKRLL